MFRLLQHSRFGLRKHSLVIYILPLNHLILSACQHLNILLLVLFLSLDGQDEPSRNSIELVFRKANEVFFLDLPETKRDILSLDLSIVLARLWRLFVM